MNWRPVLYPLMALMLCACVGPPGSAQYRKIGVVYHEKWFRSLPETPALNRVVEIKEVTIHMVSDRKDFDWDKARNKKTGVAAYADTRNQISILAKKIGGKIVINQIILGHEFKHLLNFKDRDIVDPDDRQTMESCIGRKLEPLCE